MGAWPSAPRGAGCPLPGLPDGPPYGRCGSNFPFPGEGMKVRKRRILLVGGCPSEGPFTEPTADAPPRRRGLLFVLPQRGLR